MKAEDYGEFMYKLALLRLGRESIQPFTLATARFAWRYGLQAPFLRAVTLHGTTPYWRQQKALVDFLRAVKRVRPCNIATHWLTLRNKTIRDVYQRIWACKKQYERANYKWRLSTYLEETGLGHYFASLQRRGDKWQH